MLRAAFIALSESRWLRNVAEQSSIGQRTSSRFVAGTTVADAVRATEAVDRLEIVLNGLGWLLRHSSIL